MKDEVLTPQSPSPTKEEGKATSASPQEGDQSSDDDTNSDNFPRQLELTEAEEQPLSMEERLRLKAEMEENCASLQRLLQHYQEEERKLKEEVAEFIIRDVEEHNAAAQINETVETAQVACLRNPDFVKWAAKNRKGAEFGEKDGHEHEDDAARQRWWNQLKPSSGVNTKTIALHNFSGIVPAIAGWREPNDSMDKSIAEALEDLLVVAETSSPCLIFANGTPLLNPSLNTVENGDADAFCSLVPEPASALSPEAIYQHWWKYALKRSAVTNATEARQLIDGTAEVLSGVLRDDGLDVLTAVPLKDLTSGIVARAFVVRGSVRGIETAVPTVDVVSSVFGGGEDGAQGLAASVTKVCSAAQSAGVFADHLTNAAATMLVDGSGAAPRWTIIDIHPLTPQINLTGLFTWADICGLAQQDAAASGGPQMRYQRVRVVELIPFDDATKAWFPILNTMHAMAIRTSQDPAKAPPKAAPGASSWMYTAGLCALTAGTAVAATMLVTRNRK